MRNRETIIDKYRLLHLLGKGHHTVVWLGEHIHLKKKVAIKILFPEAIHGLGEQFRAKRRFLREARTLAQFDHAHIVQVFDSGEVDGLLYFAMEYAPYGSLARRYRLGERLPLPRVRLYTSQLGRAIHYVHTQGLIHRDIKPQNMFLKARNMALLGDFGLVMPIQREYYPRMFWEFGGTRAYMAPEQQQGAPCPASDQYAFAIIIFEWLTGSSPFLGVDEEITWQRRYLSPPSLRALVPEIPAAVERVVLTGLQNTPGRRFKTMMDFTLAFEEACKPVIVRLPYDASAGRSQRQVASRRYELAPRQ